MNGSKRIGWVAGGLLGAALMVSCSLYRNDRAWMPDSQYTLARTMYIQTGSLDLVERRLTDLQWRRARINEALYRLQKEFEVLPESVTPSAEAPVTSSTLATAKPAAVTTSTMTTTVTMEPTPTGATPALTLPPPPAAK